MLNSATARFRPYSITLRHESGRPRGIAAGVCAVLVCVLAALSVFGIGSSSRSAARHGLSSMPAAARGPISAALGRDEPAYRVSGFVAHNPAQRLSARFGRSGVAIEAGSARFGIALRAVGRVGALQPIAPVAPRQRANRVTYGHGSVHEWWQNGPLGLEQGFDLARRPAGGGALAISLAVSGRVALDHGTLLLAGGLRYAGLRATDADHRPLHAWFELRGGRVLVRVDDRGARYPIRVDPFVQQAKLSASDGGRSRRARLVGRDDGEHGRGRCTSAHFVDGNNQKQGAAYVFVMPAGGWAASAKQTAELTASDGGADDHARRVGRDLREHDRRRRAQSHGRFERCTRGRRMCS